MSPPLVLRGADAAELDNAIRATRQAERWRRIREFTVVAGGWIFGAAATAVCVAHILKTPAVPVPRVAAVFLADDGSWRTAWREDLPASRREAVFRKTISNYAIRRLRWNWEAARADYDTVSAMSAPDERRRYQAVMNDPKSQDNPAVRYGDGAGASKVTVRGVNVRRVNPSAPNTVFADVLAEENTADGARRPVCYGVTMNWVEAFGLIPLDIQAQDDLAGIAVTWFHADEQPLTVCQGAAP